MQLVGHNMPHDKRIVFVCRACARGEVRPGLAARDNLSQFAVNIALREAASQVAVFARRMFPSKASDDAVNVAGAGDT
jgi:hypothetical protein